MSVQEPQHMSSAVIVIDDDEEDQAGPSTRSSGSRKRQRTAATPTSRRRPAGSRQVQNANDRQASSQQAEAVIDLTSHSLEDAGDSLPAIKQKQKKPMPAIPAIVQLAAAAQLSEDAPQPQCPICLDPMKAMACGPCGHVFCDPCIRAAVKAQKKCPTCRKTMAMKAIHRVYLDRR